jgi:hypothetical protein
MSSDCAPKTRHDLVEVTLLPKLPPNIVVSINWILHFRHRGMSFMEASCFHVMFWSKCAAKTHRELFDDWVFSLLHTSASNLIASHPRPVHAEALFDCMMRDIPSAGGAPACPLTAASYALGYNLAIEYLADYEKRWMRDSFRELDCRFLASQGVVADWTFLEVWR